MSIAVLHSRLLASYQFTKPEASFDVINKNDCHMPVCVCFMVISPEDTLDASIIIDKEATVAS